MTLRAPASSCSAAALRGVRTCDHGLDHDVHAELVPGELRPAGRLDAVAMDDNRRISHFDRVVERPVDQCRASGVGRCRYRSQRHR